MSVYRRIRRMILSGKFKGGQVLSQVQLALDFDTSRGPVREALRMLQREGLIEAETNQQGRIVTFSPADLEQVCALLALNAAMAITMAEDRLTAKDVVQIGDAIDRLETLAAPAAAWSKSPQRQVERRQLAFRRLITTLCKYSGPYVVQIIDDLLDRVAMFRQLHEIMGVSPPYPLANRFPELRAASENRDTSAIALIIVDIIADVSRKALRYVAERYQPLLLDSYVAAAEAALGRPVAALPEVARAGGMGFSGMTIKVRGLPGSKVECVITHE